MAAMDAMPPGAFRVLSSGSLALRLPDSKQGRAVWLDTTLRVKVCEHGYSYHQINHWNRAVRPTEKAAWVECGCTHARGLHTDLQARPKLPPDVPSYQSVLWRDGTPKVLEPMGALAVRIPGRSGRSKDGHEVYMDAHGKTRCPHGFTAGLLRAHIGKRRRLAALKLQEWWRVLDRPARAGVRSALLRPCEGPSIDLRRAANVWRRLGALRREAEAKERARPPTGQRARPPCGCQAAGLERERFGRGRRENFKRFREAGDAEARRVHARAALEELVPRS